MPPKVSTIWNSSPKEVFPRLETCLTDPVPESKNSVVYFRADDVGVPSENFSRLVLLFSRYEMPLCLAVVPAWLTSKRWSQLRSLTGDNQALWCWHQHGWRHANHSRTGKKYEFGPNRSRVKIENDLKRGRRRLEKIMGENFYPVFTPPWNRCDPDTLKLLGQLEYRAVSRNAGNDRTDPLKIAEYNIHVDLHTRKEKSPEKGWAGLFHELGKALKAGRCGIMIHHQRMNEQAFVFMEYFLRALAAKKNNIKTVHFEHMEKGVAGKHW